MLMLVITILILLIIGTFIYGAHLVFTLVAAIRCAPYVVSSGDRARAMLAISNIVPGMRVADLGSGDGRLLFAAAEAGADAHGFEINPILVWWSRMRARLAGTRVRVHWQSLWRASLDSFDVIFVYLMPEVMARLGAKIISEAKPGAVVVTNAFTFPGLTLEARDGRVFRYRIGGRDLELGTRELGLRQTVVGRR